jgi:hypothetical protein
VRIRTANADSDKALADACADCDRAAAYRDLAYRGAVMEFTDTGAVKELAVAGAHIFVDTGAEKDLPVRIWLWSLRIWLRSLRMWLWSSRMRVKIRYL